MSLHVGNLSSNIRRDDLQHVFRRFGRCTIQVKDKYGFVVYEYPASAEKALKTLRGTRICGQAITLSWSNRQPRALQRFATGAKSYEPRHRRHSVKENPSRRLGLYDRRDNEMDSKKADGEIRIDSSDLIDESISYAPDNSRHYVGESSRTSLTDHHGTGHAGKKHLEDGRWGEQVVDPSNENYLENGMVFDRYEPSHSEGTRELDEHQDISPLSRPPSHRNIQERIGNAYNGKSQNCYLCGEVGHKMSKCPLELKSHVSRYRQKLHPSGDNVPLRFQASDKEPSTSKSCQRLLERGDAPTLQSTPRGRKKELRDNKRNRKDYGSQGNNHLERAAGPLSSSIHSDYTSSRSQSPSRSLRSLSQPPLLSKSKPVPSEKISLSSSLGSSPSHHSGSKTFKSQSTSRSMSPTSSLLLVEVNRDVSASPNKRNKDSKGSVANAVGLAHSMDLLEEKTLLRSGRGAVRSENITPAVENEFETRPAKLDEEDMKKDLPNKDNKHCHSIPRDSHKLLEPYLPQSGGMGDSPNEEHILAPKSDNSFRSKTSNSARMSSEEVCMILKHYGLQQPEEIEKDLPVEIYLGSARLWPWEIIYYRRLKKGPISAENYSRRIAQNEEFGIVDKYVRDSTGWGELPENNP